MQLHFHSPSENTIDGKSFPLEMHLVHKDAQGNLAVVAVMFENGVANPALSELFKDVPLKAGSKELNQKSINLNALLPKDHAYYGFNGSLTTPPCSEGVTWVVLKNPVSLSAEQLKTFNNYYKGNNRPVQPINARFALHLSS